MDFLRENATGKQIQNTSDLFADDIQSNIESPSISTPVRTVVLSEEEESPYFPSCTQETNEDVDVLWDWNSPQSKPKAPLKRRSKKILNLQVPKVPLRRHLSGNNSQQIKHNFDKLKEEIRILKEEIAKPDNEESLILSPREEEVFKSETIPPYLDDLGVFEGMMEEEHHRDIPKCNFDDVFNDNLEDQLILCSQRMETKIHNVNRNQESGSGCSNIKYNPSEVLNDTLDKMLSETDTDFDQLTQIVDVKKIRKEKVFPRSNSENSCHSSQIGKFEWHRTQSFENYDATISRNMLEEIERKRLEAKAKLEAKKKLDHTISIQITEDFTDSPLKCSPEEIEKKRLHALAKLEAKRQQEIIQKKKMDALKRLEQTRKKNALTVKHSLSKKM